MTKKLTQRRDIWRTDPIKFMTQALDVKPEYVWDKMREVAESVRDNSRTVVGAGHSVSKTFSAGRLVLWFLYCFPPATVVTTAPIHKQVEELLWREIREAHTNARIPLGGKLTRTKLDLQDETGKRWYAIGFATRPDTVTSEATAFQGYHNEHILIVFDEAAGIPPQIWKAAQHLLTSGHPRWLAIGNPTSATGEFAEALEPDSGWHVINIASTDTPNYKQGREVIPGLSGRPYVQEMARKYGVDSNEYKIRVLGLKPDFTEATFFGKELAEIKAKGQLGFYPPEPAAKVYTFWDIGSSHTVIWFVQFIQTAIQIIDFYYDSRGQGLPTYAALLQQKGYTYAQHFAPWDIGGGDSRDKVGPNAKSFQTGRYVTETADSLGVPFTVIDKYPRETQWATARDLIRLCRFNEQTSLEGWDGLVQYRKKLNPTLSTTDKPVYYGEPVKDWTEHVGSAFCTLAMAYRYHLVIDNMRIGVPDPQLAVERDFDDGEPFDALRHGLVSNTGCWWGNDGQRP